MRSKNRARYLVHGQEAGWDAEASVNEEGAGEGDEGEGYSEDQGGVGLEDQQSNECDLCQNHSCLISLVLILFFVIAFVFFLSCLLHTNNDAVEEDGPVQGTTIVVVIVHVDQQVLAIEVGEAEEEDGPWEDKGGDRCIGESDDEDDQLNPTLFYD